MITFNSGSSKANQGGVSSITWSHVCSGDNRILFVNAHTQDGGDPIIGVTYNGVSLTKIASVNTGSAWYEELWYLLNPASGTHNVVVTKTGSSGSMEGGASSYAGVKQSGVPDAYTPQTGSGTPISVSVTTVADNCWTVAIGNGYDGISASTGSTYRGIGIFDSNGPKTPAGIKTMSWTNGGGARNYGIVMASFAPAPVVSSGNFFKLF